MPERYDAIIIGTGQAGPTLAWRLSEAGRKVAVIERKRFGGTCVNNSVIRREACGSRKVDSESSGHRTIELDAADCKESRSVGKVKGSSR